MAGQLIPPPEIAPTSGRVLTFEQRISAWVDLLKLGEEFVLAGLRRRLGKDADIAAAYRDWYRRKVKDHDQMMIRMLEEFDRRQSRDGK